MYSVNQSPTSNHKSAARNILWSRKLHRQMEGTSSLPPTTQQVSITAGWDEILSYDLMKNIANFTFLSPSLFLLCCFACRANKYTLALSLFHTAQLPRLAETCQTWQINSSLVTQIV